MRVRIHIKWHVDSPSGSGFLEFDKEQFESWTKHAGDGWLVRQMIQKTIADTLTIDELVVEELPE